MLLLLKWWSAVAGNTRDDDADNYDESDDDDDDDDDIQAKNEKKWTALMDQCKYELMCFLFIPFFVYLLTHLLSTSSRSG